jgi:hypothetical protein
MNADPGFRLISRPDDWLLLHGRHPNVLVTGPRDATNAFVTAVTASLRQPLRRIGCDRFPALPASAGLPGTIVLDDVEALAPADQERLMQWLDETHAVGSQMIALTTVPLYRRVQSGAFLDTLYYRLNVVHLQVCLA